MPWIHPGLLVLVVGAALFGAANPVTAGGANSVVIASAACAIGADEVDDALLPATHDDALPDGYVPPDLVSLSLFGVSERGSWELRSALIPDLMDMVQAAQADATQLSITSGYRSYPVQVATYAYWVRLFGASSADLRSARPGHSQHQLGTAIDFNLGSDFTASPAVGWLWDHAHEYGFVFPYTAASRARSGYIFEPWHVRWVGRPLAQLMWADGYQYSDEMTADDYIAIARAELLRPELAAACDPGATSPSSL